MAIISGEMGHLKVALTGSRGFIGRALMAQLHNHPFDVLPLNGDVCMPDTWQGEFDLLYHLAAAMPGRFREDPYGSYSVNLTGTLRALEACRTRDAHMVFVSTCGVYCPTNVGPLSENDIVNPQSAYAQSKLMGEMLCRSFSKDYGVRCTILRLFNIYGVHQKPDFLIPYLISCGRDRKAATVYNVNSARDFLYIDDAVQALLKTPLLSEPFGIFNIGSGTATTTRRIIDLIGLSFGRELVWHTGEGRPDPQPIVQADISLATQKMSWTPKVSLEVGLEKVVKVLTES